MQVTPPFDLVIFGGNGDLAMRKLLPALYHPLRLAEEAAVVDNLSNGRLDLVVTNGYVPSGD